jgi:hypothetical protein
MPENKSTFLNRIRIQGDEIFVDARAYLNRVYRTTGSTFTPASPYGQILIAAANIGMLILLYLEDVATSNNFLTATDVSDIYGTAQLAGHDPYRGVAAKGEIKFRFKPGTQSSFPGPHLTIPDGTQLKCLNNNLTYTLKFSQDEIRLKKDEIDFISGIIVQGEYSSQKVQGTGASMQTFNINIPGTVDHDDIKVWVNGKIWKKYSSLYDMTGDEIEGVVVRTGLSGGIDLLFGNGFFGKAPGFGAIIECQYLEHGGTAGIIDLNAGQVSFEFQDTGTDFRGNEYDLNELLISQTVHSPVLGADPENTEFTKFIAPLASKSFVLAGPENYEYFLSRYNSFSYIDAYNTRADEYLDDDNVTYLFLIPDINRKIRSDQDYFSVPEKEFTLVKSEKDAIKRTLSESGQQATTSEVSIIDPIITRYATNVVLRYFDGYDQDTLRSTIQSKLSEYFLSVRRRDKIPKSDLVSIIENIEGIDSVNVFFVSEKNEAAIANGYYIKKTFKVSPTTPFLQEGEGNKKRFVFFNKELIETKIIVEPNQDPRLGLDEFGDIVIGENELAIIRGGWSDRNDTYYNEFPISGQPSSLSIYFKEKIKQNMNTRRQSENKNKLT